MRRITAWITATVAVFALMGSYQLNAAGTTGKSEQSTSTSATTTDGAATTADKATGTNGETGEAK